MPGFGVKSSQVNPWHRLNLTRALACIDIMLLGVPCVNIGNDLINHLYRAPASTKHLGVVSQHFFAFL